MKKLYPFCILACRRIYPLFGAASAIRCYVNRPLPWSSQPSARFHEIRSPRLGQAHDARPNPAHRALAAMEAKLERFVLLTQNVDNLHQDAGSRNVIDIHGDVFAALCLACGNPDDSTARVEQAL